MKMISTQGSARARLLASTLLAGLATIAAPLAVTAIATAVPTLASAQDYTSGTLSGTVRDASGAPVAGAAVTVKSLGQGFTRALTTDDSGQFRVPLVPQGGYSVAIAKDGFQPTSDGSVAVRPGGDSAYSFTLTSADASVSEVVVTATANPQLDFAGTTTGLSVDLETLTKQVPITRNITSVVLLAPGAVQGSNANFRGQPAIGGSSVAENAFYVNGLNITNFDNYLGGSTVPFDFYKSVDVKTGGYPAEFGRSTGGIISAVTKAGTNEFKFAIRGQYEPDGLQEDQKDTFLRRGKLAKTDNKSLTLEAGGPIIKDRLFFFALAQLRDQENRFGNITGGSYNVDTQRDPFYGVKLDGYITDRQHLEFTYFDTKGSLKRKTRDYNFDGTTDTIGDRLDGTLFSLGGANYVGKYTGTFTDWFTLSAAYGVTKDDYRITPQNLSGNYVTNTADPAHPGETTVISRQKTSSYDSSYGTKREFYRVDADFYFSLFGKHHIRVGMDHEDLTLDHVNKYPGLGTDWDFLAGGATDSRGVPAGQIYVKGRTFNTGGVFEGQNEAYYIQDSWDVTSNLTLNLGVRKDKFQNSGARTSKGSETFIEFKNEIGPRIGFTYDPFSTGNDKVFGNFGRYYLPVASNTAFRQATASYDIDTFFTAPQGAKLGADGTPIRGTQITVTTNPGFTSAAACPAPVNGVTPPGITDAVGCAVRGDGSLQPFAANTSHNLKSTQEDEYIIGYEHQFDSLWKASATLTYRNLNRVSEDVAIDSSVRNYCTKNGIVGCGATYNVAVPTPGCTTFTAGPRAGQTRCRGFSGFRQYTIINPGEASTITLRQPLPGESTARTISFSRADLGYPAVKREYLGLELQVERAFDGKWGFQGSYVLSESKGNYEGFVKSDAGNGQTDSGITQDFDQVSLTDGAYGLLPNHHGHVFKAFGSYAITDSLLIGANALVLSPKHYGCIGLHPTDDIVNSGYGASSFACGGKIVPRGSSFETPWSARLDMSVRYLVPTTKFVPGGLTLRADITNLLNTRTITEAWELGEDDSGNTDSHYRNPIQYVPARAVRLGFDWEF
ncbi:TonB-dependent receptor [Caulobacter sp. DWR2-3-1b2]|uniref:TonB-dependent receptor n=1 Tax=Caulobacter sp. DWR2-3-1b2 TaxID=2804642 RepID=UPI003CE94136